MTEYYARPRVIILGAGFAGIRAAKSLADTSALVTLIDRNNYHLFQPLLYQIAMAGLSPAQIAIPIRSILRRISNVEVLLGEVTGIDLTRHLVRVGKLELDFDYLIVATGSTHTYFGHPEWEEDAPGLKTVEDALEIRRRVLLAFELAERDALTRGGHHPLNFVVIGAVQRAWNWREPLPISRSGPWSGIFGRFARTRRELFCWKEADAFCLAFPRISPPAQRRSCGI